MKIYQKTPKSQDQTGGCMQNSFYWGDPNEIHLAISKGSLEANEICEEKLHAHMDSYTYFIVISGSGEIEVEGQKIILQKDQVLEIFPGEKYRVVGSSDMQFEWIVVGTLPGNVDKEVYN